MYPDEDEEDDLDRMERDAEDGDWGGGNWLPVMRFGTTGPLSVMGCESAYFSDEMADAWSIADW